MGNYLVIDGNSLAYRAFFALPTDMATASGQVTNAVYGFTAMLIHVLQDQQPDGVLVAFDRPEPTFRQIAEPLYKAQREAAPEILRQQMGLIREVLDAIGVSRVEAAGWEADDLIAAATRRLVEQGENVIVVTGDRDSFQLVKDPNVRVMYNKRGVSDYALYDEAGIAERTGVTPQMYPQYAALRGDPSDNLPGVPGVGEKTAAKLINQYGGLDGIFENAAAQTPKLRDSLVEHEQRARKNLELMLLHADAPLESVDFDRLAVTPNPSEVKRLFDLLEFRALSDRLSAVLGPRSGIATSATREELHAEIRVLDSSVEAAALISGQELLSISAAWSASPGRSSLLGVAFVVDGPSAEVAWLPAELLSDADVRAAVNGHLLVQGHNVKELMRSAFGFGIDITGLRLDTAIAAYLIDPVESKYTLTDLIRKHTAFSPPSDPGDDGRLDLDGTARTGVDRACSDALAIWHIAGPLEASLAAHGMADLCRTLESPLVRVLAKMEHIGIAVDETALHEINNRLTGEVERLARSLREIAGRPDLNPNSPNQLRDLLYNERGLSPQGVKKTKTGYSTDAQTLEKIRDQWPEFIDPLLRHREFDKLRGTYGEGLLQEVAADGRIHATFNQTVARTGRLSSDQPNLHNIPVRSDEGRVFRTAFVARSGCQLLVADYNQIELRCIAHLSKDPGLTGAFNRGQDIHTATAARVFGVDENNVSFEQRSKAKMVSYGLAYGMEAYGLAQRLAIATDEAGAILDAYFSAFPNVRSYMETTIAAARHIGYTETLYGRRRPIPELTDSNFRVRQAAERQAMNAGIQGLAADIFKIALIRIDEALESKGYESKIVLQVHDEVIVEVPDFEHEVVGPLVISLMRSAATLDVPLEVNAAWGRTWAAAKN